ncbi:MAG: 3-deoxy-manno-octulosonate cytidylyltransferase [Opitutaceae bacterium]|nr:3-deoxy-manno-octulosonate cytidylyltransferase [Opitutaceae bacterium]
MKKPTILVVVPARMASTRFPGKPLAVLAGLPMVEHVRRRAKLCALVDDVVVATCDREILEATRAHGGRAVMTASTHVRCTDRVAEAAAHETADIIVNVQGDEPLLSPEMLDAVIRPMLEDPKLPCANLISPIPEEEGENPNLVKVTFDRQWQALYFSREAIPSRKKAGRLALQRYKQLGIIAFRRDFLTTYTRLAPTPLEELESVDMLRLLEHGYKIKFVPVASNSIGVDTPQDLVKAAELMRADPWLQHYQKMP